MIGLVDAARILQDGGILAFPTETVYGLGASAWQPDAIRKVFQAKGRPSDNPLIVHVASVEDVPAFAAEIPKAADALFRAFWPGPLTVILPKRPSVLDLITAGRPAVALRCPDHPLALELLRRSGPLVAPSANRSGRPSPTTASHVVEDFGSLIPVFDGGPCRLGLESTVVDLSQRPFAICRPGVLGASELSDAAGEPILPTPPPSDDPTPRSPGMKYTHYSPQARIFWLPLDPSASGSPSLEPPTTMILTHSSVFPGSWGVAVAYQGDFAAMAREIYDRFRQADRLGLSAVGIEPLPDPAALPSGLLAALRDRISKAIG